MNFNQAIVYKSVIIFSLIKYEKKAIFSHIEHIKNQTITDKQLITKEFNKSDQYPPHFI